MGKCRSVQYFSNILFYKIKGLIDDFFLNGKFGSLTDYWSIIVPPEEPPDHIHLH
ncbi:hypothetical protein Hanom_Chr09g00760281 [Helianthus anomalus]